VAAARSPSPVRGGVDTEPHRTRLMRINDQHMGPAGASVRKRPALQKLARIVRGADTSRLDLAPEASGLDAFSIGLSRNFDSDHEQLRHGMVMYDALYAWCRRDAHT
jgi:hypothetical protein